jgi:hypothetical protein
VEGALSAARPKAFFSVSVARYRLPSIIVRHLFLPRAKAPIAAIVQRW